MNTDINLKEMWVGQKSTPPDITQLMDKIHKLKASNLRKLVLTNVSLLLTAIFIIYIWVMAKPQFLTTKLGIILVIFSILMNLVTSYQLIPMLKKSNNLLSNSEYLSSLIAIKSKQQFLQTKVLTLYFILLSLGLALYMYEYTSRMQFIYGVLTYSISFAWIVFNWVYTRPKQIQKQNGKLDEMILKLQEITRQLEL